MKELVVKAVESWTQTSREAGFARADGSLKSEARKVGRHALPYPLGLLASSPRANGDAKVTVFVRHSSRYLMRKP